MNDSLVFFDTNILLYIFMEQSEKSVIAETLLSQTGSNKQAVISVQVLNELCHVARRKMKLNHEEISEILASIKLLCHVKPLDLASHELGMQLAKTYNFSTYDSMIVASALLADCHALYSEDMQNGLMVQDKLEIVNPFI